MMRFVGCQVVLAAVVFGLAGCGGGGEMEGMPQDTTYRAPVMPDSMKGANFQKTPAPVGKAAPAPAPAAK
jgi:hypothetical protein